MTDSPVGTERVVVLMFAGVELANAVAKGDLAMVKLFETSGT